MTQRRLAAILAADVVGFSRLIGADEAATLARLRALRTETIDPLMAEHGGRIFKTTGDGLLAEFPSAVQALRCALAIQARQRDTPDALTIRIGLHQGDVVVDGDDLLGDGINIAARIEPLAEPGGIALSARVREDAAGKVEIDVEDLGTPALKNIAQPVRVFRTRTAPPPRPALALPDKPSLVVLPFQNMSGDAEQDYFADGMVEDITTALSRIGGLFVIARNSAFTYKGRAIDVKQAGRELGVRYALEGSVRKASGRVRITCQLIETASAAHLWAERFDGSLDDIFDLQDRVTEAVAGAIEPTLRNAEIARAANKPTGNLDAYDLYLQALARYDRFSRPDLEAALALLGQAIARDPGFALAKALSGWCGVFMVSFGWWKRGTPVFAGMLEHAREALAIAPDDPTVQRYAGHAVAHLGPDNAAGRVALDRARLLNPNSAPIEFSSGWLYLYTADWAKARDCFLRAIRLSPLDPEMHFFVHGLGVALAELGEVEKGLSLLQKAAASSRGAVFGRANIIHYLVTLGRLEEARAVAREHMAHNPETIAMARLRAAPHDSAHVARWLASLRLAGIPE